MKNWQQLDPRFACLNSSLCNAECQSCRGLKRIPNKPVSLIIYTTDPSKNLGEHARCWFSDGEMFRGVHTESGPDADGNSHSPETCPFLFSHFFPLYKLININGALWALRRHQTGAAHTVPVYSLLSVIVHDAAALRHVLSNRRRGIFSILPTNEL